MQPNLGMTHSVMSWFACSRQWQGETFHSYGYQDEEPNPDFGFRTFHFEMSESWSWPLKASFTNLGMAEGRGIQCE